MHGLAPIPPCIISTPLNPCPKPLSITTMSYLIAIGPCTLQVARTKIKSLQHCTQLPQKVLLANTLFHTLWNRIQAHLINRFILVPSGHCYRFV